MTAPRTWSRHYQEPWLERTHDRRLPAWLRVAFLAYGTHRANGHANFSPGDIALVLGVVDTSTGEIKPADKHNVQRAVKAAVAAGWLSEGSSTLCLVVPGHCIQGGIGDPAEPCHLHSARAVRRSKPTLTVVAS